MSAFRQYNTTGVSHNMWGNEFCALSAFLLDDFVTLNLTNFSEVRIPCLIMGFFGLKLTFRYKFEESILIKWFLLKNSGAPCFATKCCCVCATHVIIA